MELKDIKNIYFIGAGGIGMSAIERYFISLGVIVNGYDKTENAFTKQLVSEGINIHYEDNIELLDKSAQLVVYTPAVPKDHKELNWYRNNGYDVVKRSDVLQIITADTFNICVAGTHGKTTISSMIGHVLRHTGFGCNAFLGGIAVNYGSNFWPSETNNNVCVIEADEFDRSFLKLSPDIAVVTSMDADHLDIYGTAEAIEEAFVQFAERTKTNGLLIRKNNLNKLETANVFKQITYSLNHSKANFFATNIKVKDGSYYFDANINGALIENINLNVGGLHNLENCLVAIAVAKQFKIEDKKIKAAVAAFKGVKRRFEYIVKTNKHVLVDDYAHHPEELNALISGIRSVFPERKLTLVFQPHLFSRTKDLADGFAAALDKADDIKLLSIYAARELPMAGVTSQLVLNKMKNKKKEIVEKENLIQWVKNNKPELLVMAGAGDIDAMVKQVAPYLIKNYGLRI